jgi:arginine decarboxylase
MLVPYPPGIPMSMPGERLGGPNTPVIKLILAMEEFGKRFPGFEREVHGIEVDSEGDYWMRGVIEQPLDSAVAGAQRDEEPHSQEPRAVDRLESTPVRHSTS